MDSTKKYDKPSPEDNTNIISKLFYCWVLPFLSFGYKNDIQVKDIYNTTKEDLSGHLGDALEKKWEEEVRRCKEKKQTPSLKRAIFKTFVKPYAIYGIWLFLQCIVLKMLQPIVLAEYINFYDPSSEMSKKTGWILAVLVVLMAFLNVIIMHYVTLGLQRIGMRVRIACCSLVYRKLLKLSQASLGQTAAGQLVNLLSNDVQRFDIVSIFLHYIWITPIQFVIAFYLMFRSVQYAAIAGMLAISIQAVPLQGYLSKLQGKLRFKIALKTDSRVKLMNEITNGIQVIKMYAWEKPFAAVVELARKTEINLVTKTSYIKGFSLALMVFTERTILYLTIITYVLLGEKLTGDVVFSMAQLVNTVQLYMAIFFPLAIATYAEAKVSVKRLEDFLLLGETDCSRNELKENGSVVIDSEKKGGVKLVKANASWLPNPIVGTLMDFTLDIKPGTLCCVVGNVGAGKSSFLQLLLKELPLSTGKLEISGNVSFASQEPWLFVSSVRNNILFGKPHLKKRYKDVVRVCALETDFQQLPYGDRSLVGERGVSLSGGQKARINLARSVYNEADIYLFDDPLSAVDTHVGKHLFEQCIKKYLNNKTRILVTHQLHFLKQADLIVVLSNGKIEKVGTYDELSGDELNSLKQDSHNVKEESEKPQELEKRERLMSLQSVSSIASSLAKEEEPQETDELLEKGAIPSSTYLEYFRSGAGILLLLFLIFLLIIAQMASNASDLWLTHWTNVAESSNARLHLHNTSSNETNTTFVNATASTILPENVTKMVQNETLNLPEYIRSQESYIIIYTIFIIGSIVLTTARSILFYKICMNASIALHKKMFDCILQAPMRFFDTNPSGRILNRFSKDMGAVDEILPRAFLEAIQIFLVMSGILAMVFVKIVWMIGPAFVLALLFYFARVIYLSSAQDIKRLEGITRAPVFSHISASLYGMPTIRSSNAEQMITNEFDVLQDQHTGTWVMFLASSEAFGFYLDVISTVFLSFVTFQFLILKDESTLSGNVGLVISQSLILTGMLQFGVRQSTEVASNMTSVERILQYTKLDKEGPFESLPTKKPERNWPSQGKIVYKNTYLRYVPDEAPVLKNLNIEINPGEKVGIVGRTGAGKSTMIASLFRLAPIEGTITIDDVDTSTIGLYDLRSNISIIPQEPVLFSASIRYNLDPFEKVADDVLWSALEKVELKGAIECLNQPVSEGGSNLSAGQRQLICLARAIVRNTKILVMDEATANVDPKTDSLIQTTIRKNFKNCTVLTIAHRLNTIMDSDKVLVMDAGEAVEFAHPHELLQNPDSVFSKMVSQTGNKTETELRNVAKEDYEKKYPLEETSKDNFTEKKEDDKKDD